MFASYEDSSNGSVLSMDTALDELQNFFYVTSAGNRGDISCNPAMYAKNVYGIGAYYLTSNGAIPTPYSSVCTDVDWTAPVNFTVRTPTSTTEATGTSAAAPYFLGMVALVQDYFTSKTGKPLPKGKMYQFLLDNSVDIFTPGKDSKTGHGYIVLPNPGSIDVKKYAGEGVVAPVTNYGDHGPWATDAIKYCVDNGLFKGDDKGDFRWKDPITREEMAQLIYNLQHK